VKTYQIVIEAEAERDLAEIDTYIALHDSADKAISVMAKTEQAIGKLTMLPNRGSRPNELLEHGVLDFRETFFKPYRILYRVVDDKVVVVLVADGRRDMRSLLTRRLLSA
jgi:toxin ParE1/3/4